MEWISVKKSLSSDDRRVLGTDGIKHEIYGQLSFPKAIYLLALEIKEIKNFISKKICIR